MRRVEKRRKYTNSQLKIIQDDRDFSTRYREDNVYKQKKSENIVVLIHPYRRHDEKKLDETSPKR